MGFGFVNFESNIAASAAISGLSGMKLGGDKLMKVSVARPAWKANIHSNLYIGGFPSRYTEKDVMSLLGVHSKGAEHVRLLLDSQKKLRGAAVIRMSSEGAALDLISALNSVPHEEGILQVRPWRPEFRIDRISDENIASAFNSRRPYHRHLPRASSTTITPPVFQTDDEDEHTCVLFVYHLPIDSTNELLSNLFANYESMIESVQVMTGKGYGFVEFYYKNDAIEAQSRLNGFMIAGCSRPIRIELHTDKHERSECV